MTTAELLALIERADRKLTYEQFRTWVVAQSVRNALQTFHGRWAFDPDNPGSGEGFISDGQMRALNITIRRAVHEALRQADKARNVAAQPRRRKLRCWLRGGQAAMGWRGVPGAYRAYRLTSGVLT